MEQGDLLLGRHTPVVDHYAPELLYPIPRREGRDALGLGEPPPFEGVDVWHAWELSWLDAAERPQSRIGRFTIPASSRASQLVSRTQPCDWLWNSLDGVAVPWIP